MMPTKGAAFLLHIDLGTTLFGSGVPAMTFPSALRIVDPGAKFVPLRNCVPEMFPVRHIRLKSPASNSGRAMSTYCAPLGLMPRVVSWLKKAKSFVWERLDSLGRY